MSKELFLLSSNKARQCKLELITRSLRWGSKISFYRTTELSVPKSRQVIAHAPPRLLLLKWKFPKLCMHIHTAPGADVPWRGRGDGHKATAAASLLQLMSCSPHKAGCLGAAAQRVSASPGGVHVCTALILNTAFGGLAGTAAPGGVRSPGLQPKNSPSDLGEVLLFLLRPSIIGVITLKLSLSHSGLPRLFATGVQLPSPSPAWPASKHHNWFIPAGTSLL